MKPGAFILVSQLWEQQSSVQNMFQIINRDTKEKHWLEKEGVVANIAERQ